MQWSRTVMAFLPRYFLLLSLVKGHYDPLPGNRCISLRCTGGILYVVKVKEEIGYISLFHPYINTCAHQTRTNIDPSTLLVACHSTTTFAHPGDTKELHLDDIQPFPYCAPEILLDIPFSYPINIQNAGVMVHCLSQIYLSGSFMLQILYISAMAYLQGPNPLATMGLPPSFFLHHTKLTEHLEFICRYVFNEDGKWIYSLYSWYKSRERLEGDEKVEFLRRFCSGSWRWEPLNCVMILGWNLIIYQFLREVLLKLTKNRRYIFLEHT